MAVKVMTHAIVDGKFMGTEVMNEVRSEMKPAVPACLPVRHAPYIHT